MENLHPGVKWSWRFGLFLIIIFIGPFISIPLIVVLFALTESLEIVGLLLLVIPTLIFITILILAEMFVRMSYNRYLYEFTNNGIKIERGIIWKRYSNIPYKRIQNVDVHRGIFARILGYSTVIFQTAGYSGPHAFGEGLLPAIDPKKSEEIRDMVMKKISGRGK
jgi:uncharacterized membrane protein YdbT with pleckstrin-like domain